MGTKWRNRIVIATWIVMFTFGLSGILSLFTISNSYVHRDYFHTPEFRDELHQFAGHLSMFELNNMSLEEAKKSITVTVADITEHREQFGNLTDQMVNLKAEFESRIQEAVASGNQEAADVYLAERDKKIEDMTNEFKSDDYVKAKVINEKEQKINEYYKNREYYRQEYLRYKDTFQYHFTNSVTGKVFTNLENLNDESIRDNMKPINKLFISGYSIAKESPWYSGISGFEELEDSFIAFEGQIAVPKSLSSSNLVMIEYERYKQKQIILVIYTLASIAALILCFFHLRKAKVIPARIEQWMPYYSKVPIDLRVIILILSALFAIISLSSINDQIFYEIENPFVYGWNIISCMGIASILWFFVLVQGKFLVAGLKDRTTFKKEWEKALINKGGQSIKALFNKVIRSLKDAFLNKSLGMQLFMVLLAVFGLGVATIMILVDPVFILLYLLLLMFIGVPVIIFLLISIGQFNRILMKTNELAVGNLGQDLPVSGKSVLAKLAGNINVLKQGVKTSQNEQAKSERLKTELITNVSHDLRTPLTSIITYTELLKMDDVSDEDRAAYLEIIDRKSKRLKVLIDDLFEVSKMASGNIELTMEKVDIVQLLQQALAEHDNKMNESTLQFRITYAEMPVYALVDGNKLWRVFDNLIENVLNYSMENSRVYITVLSSGDQAIITFKNVSQFELSDNNDELFERFKRGDQSRHTEGSGLGLAIAKSIVDLHQGSLAIETDGDLFKVSISLKLVI